MSSISASVGLNAANRHDDVKLVQQLLNQNRPRIVNSREIIEDGICGPKTIDAIKLFQKQIAGLNNPDGRVDPGGKTWQALSGEAAPSSSSSSSTGSSPPPGTGNSIPLAKPLLFPFSKRPTASYSVGGRRFGALRDNGARLHAGCDLLAPKNTEIHAMEDGKVTSFGAFYQGTNALVVEHTGGFLVRYGEVDPSLPPNIKVGATVKRGQHIAWVGQLTSGASMLHLEMYTGTGQGALTQGNSGYRRRGDLVDPTSYLDNATLV